MDRDAICQNCGTVWASGLLPIWEAGGLPQRIEPGEIFPAGECPSCGGLCHYVEPMCQRCDRDAVCGLLHAVRKTIFSYKHHFHGDKGLAMALGGIERILAPGCDFYKETPFAAEEEDNDT